MTVSFDASRIEGLLEVIVAASHGDFDVRIPLEERDDVLLEVELGINYMLEELANQRERSVQQHELLLTHERQLARQQAELLQALSTPILEVWPGVLALPLIGRVTEARAADITEVLLTRVAASRASHVILDLTGVDALDPGTMPALLRVRRAIELLGSRCLWSGLGPELAAQVVAQDDGAAPLRAFARLADALAGVLAARGALRR